MRRLVLLTASVLAVASCSTERSAAPASTTAPASTEAGSSTSTTGSAPTTSVDPSTSIDGATGSTVPGGTAPTSTTPPAPTTTAGGGGGGGDDGPAGPPAATSPSWFTAGAEEGDPEVSAAAGACAPFYDAIGAGSYSVQRCGVWNAVGGQRMWTLTKGASANSRFFVIVWQQSAPNVWRPVLRAVEEAAGQWADATVRTGNIDSGANDELVVGFRTAGTGGYLDMEIVDIRSGSPRVVAVFPGAAKGAAVLVPGGGVDVWSAVYGTGEPVCCPSGFQQYQILPSPGGWIVVEGVGATTGDAVIPSSQF